MGVKGGGGVVVGWYVCPKSEFQIRSFLVLRSKPCPCWYLTNVTLSPCLVSLFQGHVACYNFTQTRLHKLKSLNLENFRV